MKLSIVVPAYNEEKTLEEIINKTLALASTVELEILIVNDGSKDRTLEIAKELKTKNFSTIRILENQTNLGKSQTVRRGILESTGDFVVVQDADLEYLPEEILTLLQKAKSEDLQVVYGNRFGKKNKVIYFQNYWGNKFVSFVSNIFTFPRIRVWIPDMEVCYKLILGSVAREVASRIVSKTNFGIEPEITAKLSKYKMLGNHLKFGVVPISYIPRSIAEGKKMKAFKHGFEAIVEIVKFNLGR